MKPIKQFLKDARRNKGLALVIVLSMLALATIVILAFLSVADTEHKATMTFSASQTARRYADTAVNIVISQIRSGSAREPEPAPGTNNYPAIPVIHATQPGTVRKYDQSGNFIAGYKLFSDKDLIFRATGAAAQGRNQESEFVRNSEPPANWDAGNNLSRYVDLNEPVVKGVAAASGATDTVETIFPIIDPRAAQNVDPTGAAGVDVPVEGFSYGGLTAMSNNDLGKKVVLPAGALDSGTAQKGDTIDALRLPMPVQWLYVLQDGTIGYLDEQLRFHSSEGDTEPSDKNPIRGRIAFWTDDETCKVNINTASEPTFMGQPLYYHERDHRWADFPPARSEYQRFPGHPATVALSSVLYPNPLQDAGRVLDTYRPKRNLDDIISIKEKIYQLMPRIHTDGSKCGTQLFDSDDFNQGATTATAVAIQDAMKERLYASVDELLFSQKVSGGKRVYNDANFNGGELFNKNTLERTAAFLTANSRGSEVSMYGLPKVAMWPIAQNPDNRTGFDKLIEFCSRLGSADANNIYIFQRAKSRDANYDINIKRNVDLMNMLDKVMHAKFPGQSDNAASPGNTYALKLGQDNQRQLLVEMFDYIRCTNLYDGYLAPTRDTWKVRNNTDWVNHYRDRDQLEAQGFYKTYTPGFVKQTEDNPFNDRALPGHGQVTPAEWRVGGNVYRGFGRSISISEVGLHMICTADGQPDMYSWRMPEREQEGKRETPEGAGAIKFRIPDKNSVADIASNSQGPLDPDDAASLMANTWDPDSNPTGRISGGRTALKIQRQVRNSFQVSHDFPRGFDGSNAILTNAAENHWRTTNVADVADGMLKERYYSNFPPLSSPDAFGMYNTTSGLPAAKSKYDQMGRSFRYHPGYDWRNWNWTLEQDTPLKVDEKRIQAMLHLEFFCPSVGYPELNPEFTIVLDGKEVSSIEINGKPVFSTTKDVVIKSGQALFHPDDHPEIGGFASFRKLASGRSAPARGQLPPDKPYVNDSTGDIHASLTNLDLVSSFLTVKRDEPLKFSSGLMKIKIFDTHDYQGRDPIQTIEVQLQEGEAPTPELVVMPEYDVYQVRSDNSIYHHPAIQAPRWWAFNRGGALGRVQVGNDPGDSATTIDSEDINQTEQFWNRGRLIQVGSGDKGPADGGNAASVQATTARDVNLSSGFQQMLPGANQLIYAYENSVNFGDVRKMLPSNLKQDPNLRIAYDPGQDFNRPLNVFGTDTVRSMLPANGDPRVIFAKKYVKASEWTIHPLWNSGETYNAHNFSSYTAGGEPGFDRYGTDTVPTSIDEQAARRILPSRVKNNTSILSASYWPDSPANGLANKAAQRYFDFDDSDPGGRIGPFINKPDEGNYAVGDYQASGWPAPKRWRSTYFRNGIGARTAAATSNFFTPNRMISSPVMMGSLPTNIFGLSPKGTIANPNDSGAWRNLLFRPHVQYAGDAYSDPSEALHPGAAAPPDHYLLDMFWMPVVEPYAISEALSTAGKINMNYQIVPFTHIRRATALHALMKGEFFAAMPDIDYEASKSVKTGWGANGSTAPLFRDEANDNRYWHRSIVIDRFPPNGGRDVPWWKQQLADRVQGTLRQFEERFNFGTGPTSPGGDPDLATHRCGLFRSPSQICEIHLIPSPVANGGTLRNVQANDVAGYKDRNDKMAAFWSNHCSTGDNTRERPYSNLYARLTTRSNTFRVHVRSQTIRKATKSVEADVFDPAKDQVTSEFRGSFLLERYIDTRDAANPLPDYAAAGDPFALPPLESFYRFRILESKRFAP